MIETIDKNAMVHYLTNKKETYIKDLVKVNEQPELGTDIAEKMTNRLKSRISELNSLIDIIETKGINTAYDKHCIENGLDRTGNRFLV